MWVTVNADKSEELWISREAYGYRVETDELPALFDSLVPRARKWAIKADSARPETTSQLTKREGFRVSSADKWPGSLEDGIAHVKQYRRIHIHSRCKHLQEEARMYCYKVDRVTGEVLPIVVDKWNHGWDAVRYGLDGRIKRKRSYFG
jgi:phage terminase large subunit